MARETGVVKWFSSEKGYGFVRRSNGEDVFVHHSDIDGDGYRVLRQGEPVEFETIAADRGPKARNLVRLEPERRGTPEGGESAGADRGRRRVRSRAGAKPPQRGSEAKAAPPRESGSTGAGWRRRTLAEQIRARLGGRFPGFRR